MKYREVQCVLFAVMLFASSMQAALAEPTIGRLFFTSSQRSDLDRLRVKRSSDANTLKEASISAPRPKPSIATTIQGYVKRSDAKQSTVWVNGEALQKDAEHGLE